MSSTWRSSRCSPSAAWSSTSSSSGTAGNRRACRPGEVTAVWEGAVAIRRRLFDEVGGWPAAFRIVHEGIDLAWRVMDAGYRVEYAGDTAVRHPVPPPVPA